MSHPEHGVGDRFAHATREVDPLEAVVGIALVVALGAALLVVQEPLVHDALHDFRHVAGITCH